MIASAPTVLLGEICEVLDRRRKPITRRDRVPGPYPYYGATGVLDHVEGYLFDEPLVLAGEDGAKWGPGENTAFAVDGKCWVNNHAHVLRPDRGVLLDNWLIYYLNQSDLTLFITGLTVPKLNQGKLREIPIPLPPLAEQERIVTILDEACAAIATATANTEKNLANARELFESQLNVTLTHEGDDWSRATLDDLCAITHGFAFKGEDFAVDSDLSKPIVITPGNFTPEASLRFADKNTKRFSGDPPRGVTFDVGDLVIVMTDLSSKMKILGKPAFVERPDVLHNQRIGKVLFKSSSVDRRFLYYFLQTRRFLNEVKRTATGTMVKHTAPKRILSNVISFPTIAQQRAIIKQLDTLAIKTRSLEDRFRCRAEALTELKQSILHKAFTGELTADFKAADVALSKGEV